MLWALLLSLALNAALCLCLSRQKGVTSALTVALGTEREAYKALVAVFNDRTVGASLRHPTVRFPETGSGTRLKVDDERRERTNLQDSVRRRR